MKQVVNHLKIQIES